MLTQSKKTEERQWLKEVSSVPLQQSIRHLDVAYRNFFKSRTGKHKGKKFGLPKFNKKINNQSAEFTKTGFSLSGNYVHIAKICSIKPILSINLPSAPSSVTENFLMVPAT
jgi:putative transposase